MLFKSSTDVKIALLLLLPYVLSHIWFSYISWNKFYFSFLFARNSREYDRNGNSASAVPAPTPAPAPVRAPAAPDTTDNISPRNPAADVMDIQVMARMQEESEYIDTTRQKTVIICIKFCNIHSKS